MSRLFRTSAVTFASALALVLAVAAGPVHASLLERMSSWTRNGAEVGAGFGEVVAPAGDVDRDGYADLLVGAPGGGSSGAAYLFRGSVDGPSVTPSWTFLGPQSGAATGTTVAPAGDVNGDGYADVIVGSPLFDKPGGQDHGRIDLFFGSANGLGAAPGQTILGPVVGGQLGASIAFAGDLDGNGFDDIVVGVPFAFETFAAEGAVHAYEGGPGGLSGPTWIRWGGQVGALLGHAVSGAGDVDADGYADVVVGAPGRSVSFTRDGAAYVYRGSSTGLLQVPAASLHGASDSAAYGASVSLAGDVNADGYADVLIGSPNRKIGGTSFGEAILIGGAPGGLGVELWKAGGTTPGEFYGSRVACAGDLNGDGHPDFAVAADRFPTPAQRHGRVEVHLGGPGPYYPFEVYEGFVDGQALGAGIGTAGDLDGDAFSDLAVGAPGATDDLAGQGQVTFFRGGASLPALVPGWPVIENEVGAFFGFGLAGGIDYIGSGFNALLVSAPFADAGFNDAGRVHSIFAAHPNPLLQPNALASGTVTGMQMGLELARVGDFDGDRDEELLVGSPSYSNGQGHEGAAQVFRGGGAPYGLETPPAWSYESNVISRQTGRSVGSADFNGDGFADLAVGSFRGDAMGFDGDVKVYHGGPGGPPAPTMPSWASPPLSGDTFFAGALATGDWDADGFSDLAVGAHNEANGETGEGRVRVFFGSPAGLGLQPSWILEINVPSGQFGYSVEDAGDFNGDGVADLVVAAPTAGDGQAWVFFGSRSRSTPRLDQARRLVSDSPVGGFARYVTGVGDVDKDGYGDILVGNPLYSNGEAQEGKIWLFRGSNVNLVTPWWSVEPNAAGMNFGTTVERCGDLNLDGWPDFAVSAIQMAPGGGVFVYLGGGQPTYRWIAQGAQQFALPIGGRVEAPGDFKIFHTLRSPMGRERVRAQFQVATQNESFVSGTLSLGGTFDTGPPPPGAHGSTATFAFPYASLTPGIGYRFRTRNLPRAPFFAPSPWSQPRGFEDASVHFRVAGTVVDAPGTGAPVPGGLTFRGITPSPFRDAARIAFVTPRDGRATLDVFDASGRHVRRLATESAEAGEHVVAFDGRTSEGAALAAGVYFLRLELAGESAVAKLVRLPD